MSRHFIRLPALGTPEEVIDWAAEHGWSEPPTLHASPSEPVVGIVEIRPREGGLRILLLSE